MKTSIAIIFAGMALALSSGMASAANPYNLADGCMPFYEDYTQAAAPKAFAAAKNGRCGSWRAAASPQEAKQKAMELCTQYGGTGCRLVEHLDQ